jgi:RNA-directed DNA polymerase
MSREVHVRFCESLRVKFPWATRRNIYVGSERAGDRVMDSTRRFIERRLRLKVNEEKSKVTRPDQTHFLGFRLSKGPEGQVEVQLSERSRKRMDIKIRELTPRGWGQSLSSCIEQLNRYLGGWGAYFRLCTQVEAYFFRKFDAHIRRRLRAIILKQKKRPRFLFRHLCKRGVSREVAGASAYCQGGTWRRSISNGMHQAYPNAWFAERLMRLEDLLVPRPTLEPVSGQQLLLFG